MLPFLMYCIALWTHPRLVFNLKGIYSKCPILISHIFSSVFWNECLKSKQVRASIQVWSQVFSKSWIDRKSRSLSNLQIQRLSCYSTEGKYSLYFGELCMYKFINRIFEKCFFDCYITSLCTCTTNISTAKSVCYLLLQKMSLIAL